MILKMGLVGPNCRFFSQNNIGKGQGYDFAMAIKICLCHENIPFRISRLYIGVRSGTSG